MANELHHRFHKQVEKLNSDFFIWVQRELAKDRCGSLRTGAKQYLERLEKLEKETGYVAVEARLPEGVGVCPLTLTPKQITKVVHFVRHGNGYHNPPTLQDQVDPHLTPLGWHQTRELRQHLRNLPKALPVDLVVVSPLQRTLETAAGVFGEDMPSHSQELLMRETGESPGVCPAHAALYKPKSLPFVAQELCRELLMGNNCDRRRRRTELKHQFVGVDFSRIQNDDDVLAAKIKDEWGFKARIRAQELLKWLIHRPQEHIAVVTHCSFLGFLMDEACKHLQGEVGKVSSELFHNCEIRTFVMALGDSSLLPALPKDTWYRPSQGV